jgi:hypothetical protein
MLALVSSKAVTVSIFFIAVSRLVSFFQSFFRVSRKNRVNRTIVNPSSTVEIA